VRQGSRRARSRWIAGLPPGRANGATLGGLLAVWLIGAWGWRSVFVFGAGLTVAVIPLVCLCLPESLDFLLARRASALTRCNARGGRRARRKSSDSGRHRQTSGLTARVRPAPKTTTERPPQAPISHT
ncbi:hypothetical protein ACV34M_30980, partial [Pseudomonas aeruginosa]